MKNAIVKTKLLIFAIILIPIISFLGCKEDSVSPQTDNLDFSVKGSSDSTDNIGILRLTEVKILLKDIKLNIAGNQDSNNFQTGPFVLYLNLLTNVNVIGTGLIPAGTYDKVRFMVHKLENNETPPDPEFADANGRYSVIVKGTYGGVPFVYKSTKSAHQKLTFPGNLQVTATGKSNITLLVKPYMWFIKNNAYLDPLDPSNENDIDNNIKNNINNNFKCFVDNDRNGAPD
ncbi:MAG: hypothetical protein SGI89_11585 [bacterium]|nr:hypothetical protein [bacterium]